MHEACGSPLCVYVCDHKCIDLYKAITRYRHIHIVSRLYIIIMYTCIFYAIGDTISIDRHVGKCVCVCVCVCACVCMRVCVRACVCACVCEVDDSVHHARSLNKPQNYCSASRIHVQLCACVCVRVHVCACVCVKLMIASTMHAH